MEELGKERRRRREEEVEGGGERMAEERGGGPSAGSFSEPRSALMGLRHENWRLI